MSFLKPKTSSNNQAYGFIKDAYDGTVQMGNNATNFIGGLLGIPGGDSAGASAAFDAYKDQAGYAPALRDMQRGVTGGAAAQGILNSGMTSRALLKKGNELNSGMFGNFLQQLAGLSGLGMNAGQAISGAGGGQKVASTGSKLLSAAGSIASIFSDRRTKRDIEEFSRFDDGLGVYTFRYLDDDEIRIGVMADEVEAIRPWALGPVVGGFQTVNYAAL